MSTVRCPGMQQCLSGQCAPVFLSWGTGSQAAGRILRQGTSHLLGHNVLCLRR